MVRDFMETISDVQAEDNLAEIMNRAIRNHLPVMITRENGDAVVLISLEDYEAMGETAYLLQSPKNAQRLLESVLEVESEGGQERELLA